MKNKDKSLKYCYERILIISIDIQKFWFNKTGLLEQFLQMPQNLIG